MLPDGVDRIPGALPPSPALRLGPGLSVPVRGAVHDDGFDEEPPRQLREYLEVLRRQRRLALSCFAGVLVLTVLVTLLVPRRYTAATRIEVARQSPIQLRLADNVRRLDDSDPTVAQTFVSTQVAALQSRDLAARVLGRHGLGADETFLTPAPERGPLARAATLVETLRPRGWQAPGAASVPPAATPAADGAVDPRLLDRYMKYLAVSEVRGTDLIEVSFTTPSPTLSAYLAAAHTQAFIEANDEARQATDTVADSFLERQLADARTQLEQREAALTAFAGEHPNVAIDQGQKVAAARIGELSTLLTNAEATRTSLESRYEFLTGPESDRLAYFLDRPGVEKLRLSLLDVRAQEAALRPRLGPNHPQMQELTGLESEISRQLDGEVQQGVEAARSHLEAARMREDRLRAKLERQEEQAAGLRELGTRWDLLEKDAETARKLHASLLRQRVETRVNAALVPPNVRVIERPEVPHKPSRPKVPLNLALGAFGAAVVAIGAAFGRDYLDSSLKSSDEAEGLLQLPALAAIPNFALAQAAAVGANGNGHRLADRSTELLVLDAPWSRVAEAFRSLRTVLFSSPDGPPRVVLVTSARPAEGKTVASLNVAGTLAELGLRTLLLDADLRHPRCHAALAVPNVAGLSTWLAGEAELDTLIRPLEAPGLFFLPAGPPPENPATLVASERMRQAFAELRARFDFIVVDTPPVLPVSDAVTLARLADGVLLVVKGHETPVAVVRHARDRLLQVGARFLGVIMNDVGLGWGDPYFYDTYYEPGGRRPA